MIVTEEGWNGIYDLHAQRCSCIAYSQDEKCICAMLAQLLDLKHDSGIYPVSDPRESQPLPSDVSIHASESAIQDKLNDLLSWTSSDKFTPIPEVNDLICRAHAIVFSSFKKVTSQKSILPLHPYRKALTGSSESQDVEHNYSESKKVRHLR